MDVQKEVSENLETVSLFAASTFEEYEEPKKKVPHWIVTFADLITLLLAFFVILLSFSDTNKIRFRDVSGSLQKSLGNQNSLPIISSPIPNSKLVGENSKNNNSQKKNQLSQDLNNFKNSFSRDIVGQKLKIFQGNKSIIIEFPERKNKIITQEMIDLFSRISNFQSNTISPIEIIEASDNNKNIFYTEKKVQLFREKLSDEILLGDVEVSRDEDKIIFRLLVKGNFYSGSAELASNFLPILKKISKIILNQEGNIVIEGHTDNVPVKEAKRFRSNWDLSGARASSVADYIIDEGGISKQRVAVRGLADTKPIAPNDSIENRSKNRRIEILIESF